MQFDIIPFEDIKGDWKKLGSGSFGNVYKGIYLGTDVAIKEVLPSNDYDVRKYFEREWKLMREARHPNVVLFIGLSQAPAPDGRVFIVSEFIENGNLRQYIFAKSKPFPWRLRLSFCIDIARALAYLHARNCVHRDIKGENLLLTPNGRLKITDFGFARITPRNEDEAKRLTFCGTDAYMSPEILIGELFDLPTDVFSLGIIFCEIISRKVADDKTFKRVAPTYALDPVELHRLASPDCPPELISLALDCCSVKPSDRPSMVEVLSRLSAIEQAVLADEKEAVGTIRFFTAESAMPNGKGRRPRSAPRIPSFGMGVGTGFNIDMARSSSPEAVPIADDDPDGEVDDDEDVDMSDVEVLMDPDAVLGSRTNVKRTPSWATYGTVEMGASSYLADNQTWSEAGQILPSQMNSNTRLLAHAESLGTSPDLEPEHDEEVGGSTMTVRASQGTLRSAPNSAPNSASNEEAAGVPFGRQYVSAGVQSPTPPHDESTVSVASFHTAPSVAARHQAEASSNSQLSHASSKVPVHRFTLIKSSTSRRLPDSPGAVSASGGSTTWSPFAFFFSNPLLPLGAKCDLCAKRLGWKAALECDDCGMRCHVKCGDVAPRDCGVRFPKATPALPISPSQPRPDPHDHALANTVSSPLPGLNRKKSPGTGWGTRGR